MRNVVNVSHMVYCQNSESRVISYTPENKDIIEIFMNKSIISLFSNNTYDCLGGVMVRFNLQSDQTKDNTFGMCCFFTKVRNYYNKDTKGQHYIFPSSSYSI